MAITAGFAASLIILEISLAVIGYLHSSAIKKEQNTTDKNQYQYSILCIGDSFTEGCGAETKSQTYPAALQTLFDAAMPGKVKVFNRGIASANTTIILESIEPNLKSTQPDLVIIMAGWSNFWNLYGFTSFEKGKNWKSILKDYLYKIHTYKLAILLWNNLRLKTNSYPHSATIEHYPTDENFPYARIVPYNFFVCPDKQTDPFLPLYHDLPGYRIDTDSTSAAVKNYLKGKKAYEQSNLRKAEIIFRQGIAQYPDDASNYFGMTQILLKQNKLAQAEQILVKAFNTHPESPDFRLCLQNMYVNSNVIEPGNIDRKIRSIEYFPQTRLFFDDLINHIIPTMQVTQAQLAEIKKLFEKLSPQSPYAKEFSGILKYLNNNADSAYTLNKINAWRKSELEQIIDRCSAAGAEIILQTYPLKPHNPIEGIVATRAILDVAKSKKLPVVDNEKIFRNLSGREKYFTQEDHCNGQGYELMAKNLYDKITTDLMPKQN